MSRQSLRLSNIIKDNYEIDKYKFFLHKKGINESINVYSMKL